MAGRESRSKFNQYPLAWIAICVALGIFLSNQANIDVRVSLTVAAAMSMAAIAFGRQNFAFIFVFIAFIATGVFCFQIEKQRNSENRLRTLYDEGVINSADPVEIEGTMSGSPELTVDGVFLTVRAAEVVHRGVVRPIRGNVRLSLATGDEEAKRQLDDLDLRYGSRVRIAADLEREDKFLNPGVVPHKTLLDQEDIDATGTLKSTLLIEKLGEDAVFPPLAWVYAQRQNLISEFRHRFRPATAGILIASLLGDKFFLDKQTADLFREGGTFHVLIINGLHITFIGGVLLLLVRFFTRKPLWQFLITCMILWAYTLAVGAHVPVVRASLMFTILLLSQVIYRRGTLLNALGLCALVVLIWRPSDLFTAAFQLTFVTVAAIVGFGIPLLENLQKIGAWMPTAESPFPPNVPVWVKRSCETLFWNPTEWQIESGRQVWSARLFKSPYFTWLTAWNLRGLAAYIFEGIVITLTIQFWLLPLLVVYFHRVSVVSFMLNLWALLFIALESFAAVFAVILGHISEIAAWPFTQLTEIFNWFLVAIPGFFSARDWASFRLPAYTGEMRFIYVLYFIPLLVMGHLLYRWRPFDPAPMPNGMSIRRMSLYSATVSALALAAIIVFHPYSAPTPDGRLHVDFLDVGQGDSALVTFPTGETLLIDGGGRGTFRKSAESDEDEEPFEPDARRIGEVVVSEFLWFRGYSKIDYILATHADADHIQGLADVARNFTVSTALVARTPVKNPGFAELYAVLAKKSVPTRLVSRGDKLEIGNALIEFIYPDADANPDAVYDNNHCLVVRISFGNRRFLFTGDIEKQAESDMLAEPETVRSDIVKVPHHGSRTSSTQPFIEAAAPEFAIISVGRRSRFGHPHKEVVERWLNAGAVVKRTGEKGMISVSTDGRDLVMGQFLP